MNGIWQSSHVAIFTDASDPEFGSTPSVVTIGVFDGVHRGHQALVAEAGAVAAERHAQVVAVTFDPHPVAVLAPHKAPAMLTTIERRVELLQAAGAQHVRVLNFTAEMAGWTPAAFIDAVVVDACHAVHVVVGQNFRFGKGAAGDLAFMQHEGHKHGFSAAEAVLVGDDQPFSSTRIRQLIERGEMAEALRLLGRPAEYSGTVQVGDRRGRELGFPTANILADQRFAVPPDGVYAGWLVLADGTRHVSAISIGTNPTFQGVRGRRVEAYAIGVDLDIYNQQVRVEFDELIRPMLQFASVDELVEQMKRDVAQTVRLLQP